MSSTGMSWARQQKAGNATAKAVLLLLGELVGDDGISTRSQTQLAEILECNRDTVGRALTHLEKANLIRRERRQASDTKRLSDRIVLQMAETFTVTTLENDVPEPEETEHANIEHSNIEHSETTQREHANIEQREHANIEQSINSSLNSQVTSSGDGASAAQAQELELPGIAAKTVAELTPDKYIAAKISTWLKDAQSFHAIRGIATWALGAYPDMTPDEIGAVMVAIVRAGKHITKINIHAHIQGYSNRGTPKPSTTNQRVSSALDRAAMWEAREEAQSANR